MFTRAYYIGVGHLMLRTNKITSTQYVKTFDGSNNKVDDSFYNLPSYFNSALNTPKQTETSSSSGVYFGNGDTPPTLDDFKLAGSNFTNFSSSHTFSFDPVNCVSTVIYTLTNNGSTAFTIKEVGVFISASGTILAMREVLDTPVTIEPGGVGQVTLTFKVNIPE